MSESAEPLSVEQAIASLVTPPVDELDAPQAEAAAAPEESEGEASTPEDAADEPEQLADGEETDAEAEPVAAQDPPRYWSKDAKDAFAKLPADLQAVVLAQEGPREEATAKAKSEAAERVKAADAELSKVQDLAVALNEHLPQWIQSFGSRWGQNPDWLAFAQEHGAEAMTLAKTQYEAERQQLQAAAVKADEARQLAHQAFVKTEFARLAELEPDLAPSAADPKLGIEKRQGVVKFLIERGIPQDSIAQISAVEMSLAYDAMRWREAQTALRTAPKPKPLAPAPKAAVRPGAAQAQPSSQRSAKEVAGRFYAKPTVDNAVALLLASKAK